MSSLNLASTSRTRHVSRNARLTVSTRVSARSTFTLTSASTVAPANRSARSRPSPTKMTPPSSGRTSTRPTSSSSTTSVAPAVPPSSARSRRTTRWWLPCRSRSTKSRTERSARQWAMTPTSTMDSLPQFPWDSLAPYKERASSHVEGLVDLSVGTPVDPTQEVVMADLKAAADAHGYPQTWGTPALREAVAAWFARRRGVPDVDPDGVLPTVGSKELVAWLPTLLGAGPGDVVAFPALAYPTYDVGARLAGAWPQPVRALSALGPMTPATAPKLLWVNSPSNPTGQVLGVEHLAKIVRWARRHAVIVASDECYAELDWRADVMAGGSQLPSPGAVPSILDPRVCDGSHEGLLAVYSLSKQSNMAGYRAAFVAGDPVLV